MSNSILCYLDFHKPTSTMKFYPNIHAPVVARYEHIVSCSRCSKILKQTDCYWTGTEFVDLISGFGESED